MMKRRWKPNPKARTKMATTMEKRATVLITFSSMRMKMPKNPMKRSWQRKFSQAVVMMIDPRGHCQH